MAGGLGWQPVGADTTLGEVGIDTTPSIPYEHSFRGGPDLEPEDDFHRNANEDEATEQMPVSGFEANDQHPEMRNPREYDQMAGGLDWQPVGADTTLGEVGIDTTPSIPYEHSFRGGPDLEPEDDFHRNANEDEATEQMPVSGMEPNDQHPALRNHRDFDKVEPELDWQPTDERGDAMEALPVSGMEPNDQHPALRNHRDFDKVDPAIDWQPTDERGDAMEALPVSGMEPNDQHPALRNHRDFDKVDPAIDWQPTGKETTMWQIDPDASPAITYEHSFRGGPDLEPEDDFHRNANEDEATEQMPVSGMEPNSTRPHEFRDLDTIDSNTDWQTVSKETTAWQVENDSTPSFEYEHSFRGGPQLDAFEDFQRIAADETAIVPLESGTLEANEKHVSLMTGRDFQFDGETFRSGGVDNSTHRVPGGIEANKIHPGTMNHRDFAKYAGDVNFKIGGTANELIARKKEYGEDEGLVGEFDFRVAAAKELEEKSLAASTASGASGGWNSSTKVPQGKLVMDRRRGPNPASPAGRLFQSPKRRVESPAKKAPKGWSMAMLDAQRKSGTTPAKSPTKKAAQKENKKRGVSSTTTTPTKRTPKKATKGSPSTPSGGDLGTVWKKVDATATVQAYWYNVETRETSWTPPKKNKKKKNKKTKPSGLTRVVTAGL
eukprot:gene7486-24212_t